MTSPSENLPELSTRVTALEETVRLLSARLVHLEQLSPRAALAPEPRAETASRPPATIASSARPRASESEPVLPPPLPVTPSIPPPLAPASAHEFRPRPRPRKPSAWAERLRAVHLLPPSGGAAEAQLGAWWATRIGALLAMIGVVFFGAYLSIGTPPWVKLAELLAATVGVGALGLWLERRTPKFGAVVFGLSLAMLYFCAFAAYSIPAVRVIEGEATAMATRLLAAGVVLGAALGRRSQTTATMAIVLGFATIGFSLDEAYWNFELPTAWALTAAAAGLRAWRGWKTPVVAAVPLGALVVLGWIVREAVGLVPVEPASSPWAWLIGYVGVVWLGVRGLPKSDSGKTDRRLALLAFALFAGLGWLAIRLLEPERQAAFYFVAAAAALLLAALEWRMKRVASVPESDSTAVWFYVKACALLGLGLVAQFDARTRWLALLAQAFPMLVALRAERRTALWGAAAAVWLASAGLFLFDHGSVAAAVPLSPVLAGVLWAAGSGLFLILLMRLRPAFSADTALAAEGVLGTVLGAGVVFLVDRHGGWDWRPSLVLGAALALGATAWKARDRSNGVAAGIGFAASWAWMLAADLGSSGWEPSVNQALLSAVTVALGWKVTSHRWGEADAEGSSRLGLGLHALALYGLLRLLTERLPLPPALVASGVVALGVAAAAARWPRQALALLLPWILPTALVLAATSVSSLTVAHRTAWLGLAAGVAWSLALLPYLVPALREQRKGFWDWVQAASALVLTGAALAGSVFEAQLPAVSVLLGVGVGFFFLRPGLRSAPAASTVLVLLGGAYGIGDARLSWLIAALAAAVWLAVLPLLAGRWDEVWSRRRRAAAWGYGLAAMGLGLMACLETATPVARYATVGWGAVAAGLFGLGLVARRRPYRLLGLAGLALAVTRVFAVDLESTLGRIIAFLALGVLAMGVGFTYHRFRHLIAEDDPAPAAPPPLP